MLAHRLAQHYGMQTSVEVVDVEVPNGQVVARKTAATALPAVSALTVSSLALCLSSQQLLAYLADFPPLLSSWIRISPLSSPLPVFSDAALWRDDGRSSWPASAPQQRTVGQLRARRPGRCPSG